MRKRLTRLAVLAGAASLAATGLSAAPALASVNPQLNNGTWCGAWLSNQGITSRPCLTFSGGQVRGYVGIAATTSGCSASVSLYGPTDTTVNVPCNNNAGTYFSYQPYGWWETCVSIYKNGANITGQCSPGEYGP